MIILLKKHEKQEAFKGVECCDTDRVVVFFFNILSVLCGCSLVGSNFIHDSACGCYNAKLYEASPSFRLDKAQARIIILFASFQFCASASIETIH